MTIVGLLRRYSPSTIGQINTQWSAVQSEAAAVTGRVGGESYGVWYDVLKGGREFLYRTGVTVGEFAPVHPGLSRAIIPAQRYAVFVHQGSVGEVRQTVDGVLSQWLPKSGYRVSHPQPEAPDFIERYSAEFASTGKGSIEIWLPVTK
jgi:AraC family transcriptional regulator